ncbi:NTP transferase domain-containing protein [Candidatus Woesearchaeota archaeon]|nr:NTP transferase domain-containing protein [Candidatus Woesearchaeota archaeon]
MDSYRNSSEKMENYKVCILAAGIGSRMGAVTEHINKAILPVNNKAVISHIIEKFPQEIEIVIAVGHLKESVMDYVAIAHPERKISYVIVEHYLGPGTGPGYSLLQCKEQLQCPFIFYVADTLLLEEIPPPDKNWFGVAPVKKTEEYCTVKIKNNLIVQLDDKIKCGNKFAFIGVAGVYDYLDFFDSLEKNKELKGGEIQVSNGFTRLIEKKLVPVGVTWFDTGTLENYRETSKNFSGGNAGFDFSKGNEFIYFVNGRVIKYFANVEITKNRYDRAKHLQGLCPTIEAIRGNFYSYRKLNGQVLYDVLNSQIVNDFLQWSKLNLWKKKNLTEEEKHQFSRACRKFYYDKTLERIKQFHDKKGIEDTANNINGISVPPLKELLGQIDWEKIINGTPTLFHGDLQFDNVLVTRDEKTNLPKFILLDWRQDFGGMIQVGDLYYDLAKLYGGVTMSYKLIKEGKFSFDMSGSSVYYNYSVNNDLIEAREEYEHFIQRSGLDLQKIKIIRALIFLNMSPLHHDPFDLMLYFKGKLLLYKALKSWIPESEANSTIRQKENITESTDRKEEI